MADHEMVVDVGVVELVQLGMFGKIGVSHVVEPGRLSLMVLNDQRDVRYEVKAGSQHKVIEPAPADAFCVLLVTGPDPDPNLMDLAAPTRLFKYYFDGHPWPELKFTQEGTGPNPSPFNTACVVLHDRLNWTSVERTRGHFALHSTLPAGCRVWECVKTPTGDKREQVFDGNVDAVAVVGRGGPQPVCCSTGWPP